MLKVAFLGIMTLSLFFHIILSSSSMLINQGLNEKESINLTSQIEIHVPNDFQNIQDAINASSGGAIIKISPGIFKENLFIDKPITLLGDNTIVSPIANDPGIFIDNAEEVLISGLSIQPDFLDNQLDSVGIKVIGQTNLSLNNLKILNFSKSLHLISGSTVIAKELLLSSNELFTTSSAIVVKNSKLSLEDSQMFFQSIDIDGSHLFLSNESNLELRNNQITFFGPNRGISSALFLIDSQAIIQGNNILGKRAEGIIIEGSRGLNIVENTIHSNVFGINIFRSRPEYSSENIMISKNHLLGLNNSGTGLKIDSMSVNANNNLIKGFTNGIKISFEAEVLLTENSIFGNSSHGIIADTSASSINLISNRIIGNAECGLKVFDVLPTHERLKEITGQSNLFLSNKFNNLCLSKFSVSEGFLSVF